MDKMDLLVSDFSALETKVTAQLSDMQAVIAERRAPGKSTINELESVMNDLKLKYDDIYSLAKSTVGDDERPEADLSVNVYANMYHENRLNAEIANTKTIFSSFVAVKAKTGEYAEVLEPFQDKAVTMLQRIGKMTKNQIPTDMKNASEECKLFLEAIDTDFTLSDSFELQKKLNSVYPFIIHTGLALKLYYVSDSVVTPLPIKDNAVLVNTDSAAKELIQQKAVNHSDVDEFQPEGDTIAPTTAIINKNPSASAFKNDIFFKMPVESRTILPLFTNLGVLTSDHIYEFGICLGRLTDNPKTRPTVDRSLERLISRNYIVAYQSESEQLAYCLTAYGYGCMHKETIKNVKNFWDLSYGNYKFIAQDNMYLAKIQNALHHNDLLLTYLGGLKGKIGKKDYKQIKKSITWSKDHYSVSVIWQGEQYHCALSNEKTALNNTDSENILCIADTLPEFIEITDTGRSLFCFCNSVLYKWTGVWSPSEAESDEESNPKEELNISCEEIENKKEYVDEIPANHEISHSEVDIIHNEPEKVAPVSTETPCLEKASKATTPAEMSKNLLKYCNKSNIIPTEQQFEDVIFALLESGKIINEKEIVQNELIQAVLLAQTASYIPAYSKVQMLYQQLLTATILPPGSPEYQGDHLDSLFKEYDERTECLMLASYMNAMICPHQAYDHKLQHKTDTLFNDYEYRFPSFPTLKPLFHVLLKVQDVSPTGFTDAILSLLGDEAKSATFLKNLQNKAKELLAEPVIKTKLSGLRELCNSCFGSDSDLYACMEIISENRRDEKELVEAVLHNYGNLQTGAFKLDESIIKDKVNKEWSKATLVKSKKKFDHLIPAVRKQIHDAFHQRLSLIQTWLETEEHKEVHDINSLKNLKDELVHTITDLTNNLSEIDPPEHKTILSLMYHNMLNRLTGNPANEFLYADLLRTGIISLDENGTPILDEKQNEITYYEPWRNMLKHIAEPIRILSYVKKQIFNKESPMFDNLHQFAMIGKYLNDDPDYYIVSDQQIQDAEDLGERNIDKFQETLELAYAYNRISENDKENLLADMQQYKESFFTLRDFGCWKQFLDALKEQVKELTAEMGQKLRVDLDDRKAKLKSGETSKLLEEAYTLLEKDKNFAVVEEYINRFDNGQRDIPDELQAVLHDPDSFADFLSDEVFEPLYRECERNKGRALKKFGWEYMFKHTPKDWTTRQIEDSKKFITSWPARKDVTENSKQIQQFFQSIGLYVKKVTKVTGQKEERYNLYVKSTERNLADYRHPISAFGTQMKPFVTVTVLYGNYTAKQLVDTVCSLNLGEISIVLIDRPLDRGTRRQIAEIFHTQTSKQNPFLLIDQVLALYLAGHQTTERLPVMLKCTLPYTTYQPFVRDGGSVTDEMFFGRVQELATIIDPNGACVVYGGRQLGKTALLERAESLQTKPDKKEYAVLVNIDRCKQEDLLVAKIIGEINKKTNLYFKPSNTIKDFCNQIDERMRNGKIHAILLLLDEVDDFLGAISAVKYKPLQPLVDLKRGTKNKFKFVLAGLHNVCRAQNATALNGLFGQLGTPLCIKPLSPTDALQLLSRPLRYLGFQIDKNSHLETILTNTNYYPGILQFFGYTLVETLTGQYSKYFSAAHGNPPFKLQDDHLGSVMNSADLNRSIKDKFRLSLDLDTRYFMLARCITMLYHLSEGTTSSRHGFTVDEIIEIVRIYDIHILNEENKDGFETLLGEMVDMGILSRPQTNTYRLRRHSFINIIGPDMDELDQDIIEANKKGGAHNA